MTFISIVITFCIKRYLSKPYGSDGLGLYKKTSTLDLDKILDNDLTGDDSSDDATPSIAMRRLDKGQDSLDDNKKYLTMRRSYDSNDDVRARSIKPPTPVWRGGGNEANFKKPFLTDSATIPTSVENDLAARSLL